MLHGSNLSLKYPFNKYKLINNIQTVRFGKKESFSLFFRRVVATDKFSADDGAAVARVAILLLLNAFLKASVVGIGSGQQVIHQAFREKNIILLLFLSDEKFYL